MQLVPITLEALIVLGEVTFYLHFPRKGSEFILETLRLKDSKIDYWNSNDESWENICRGNTALNNIYLSNNSLYLLTNKETNDTRSK